MSESRGKLVAPSPDALDRIYESVKNWGRWGGDDQRGALGFLTPGCRARAGALVREGESISLAHDLPVQPSVETPFPAQHHMLTAGDARDASGIPGYEAAGDYLATQVHGMGITHVDALCHIFVRGQMYNGVPAEQVRSNGALRNSIMALADGLVGRGVLLDIPALRGVDFLDANDPIGVADLEAAERAQGLRVESGDILIVSTGRDARRRAAQGRLDPFGEGLAGLHPECLPWLHERCVAALGSDGISDMMPGLGIEGWPFPIHQAGIAGIGLHLIDNMHLDPVLQACAERQRWEFLLMLAPIRLQGGTGCPVNPLAVL
jgi:kynurenine formamidase